MDDDRLRDRAREFSRRELLRAGWVVPVVVSIGAISGCSSDWDRIRADRRDAQRPVRSGHADAPHIDSGVGADHADVPYADSSAESPAASSTTSPRRGTAPSHSDAPAHTDVPPHADTPHGDEHNDVGIANTPDHLDVPYGDHTDAPDTYTVHDDSPHADELFLDEAFTDPAHGDTPHVDVPHADS